MLIPLIGFEELPRRPLMRAATGTKRKPKTVTKIPAKRLRYQRVSARGIGWNVRRIHIIAIMTSEPTTTQRSGMSRSMRLIAVDSPAPSARTSLRPARRAVKIVGSVRQRVIRPAAATAPAPIGRMYVPTIWSGVIIGVGIVDG